MKRIPLRRRDGSVVEHAIVDDADFEDLDGFRWYMSSNGYALRQYREPSDPPGRKRSRGEFMHRRVLGLKPGDGKQADHRNGFKLDNRRSNLHVVTQAQNERNKVGVRAASGHRHVFFDRGRGKFFARVRVNGRQLTRGYFTTPQRAAMEAVKLRERADAEVR